MESTQHTHPQKFLISLHANEFTFVQGELTNNRTTWLMIKGLNSIIRWEMVIGHKYMQILYCLRTSIINETKRKPFRTITSSAVVTALSFWCDMLCNRSFSDCLRKKHAERMRHHPPPQNKRECDKSTLARELEAKFEQLKLKLLI